MLLQTRCTYCGQVFAAPAEMAGKTVNCPNCNQRFFIPVPEGMYRDPGDPERMSAGSVATVLGMSAATFLVSCVVLAAIGIGAAGLTWLFFGSGFDPDDPQIPNPLLSRNRNASNRSDASTPYADDSLDADDNDDSSDDGDIDGEDLTNDSSSDSGSPYASGSGFDDGAPSSPFNDPTNDPPSDDEPDTRIADDDADGSAAPSNWNVTPEPRPMAASFATKIDLGKANVAGAVFSGPSAAQVAVHVQAPKQNGGTGFFVRRYDLKSGQLSGQFPVAPGSELMDFQPDARVAVVRGPSGQALDLWSCSSGGDKTFANWPRANDRQAFPVAMAMCIDTDRLLLLSKNQQRLQMLTRPVFDVNYTRQWAIGRTSVFSWNRRYLVTWDDSQANSGLLFVDINDGNTIGQTARLPDDVDSFSGAVFSSGGDLLVATFRDGSATLVTSWDVRTGELLRHFRIPRVRGYHHWLGPRFLLVGDSLVDAETRALVWKYRVSTPALPRSPNDQVWFVFSTGNSQSALVAHTMPSLSVMKIIDDAESEYRSTNGGSLGNLWAGKSGLGQSTLSNSGEKVSVSNN